ncbi:conserved hypothetical protein [Mesorhizobium prunaredense]|uniref:Uncharacterized protein n=2 Tax=Mesorhizobium prunaredense TaxID=1631249 RepID=A0A1R3V7V4_9HYPH|nr:conserved hypothetical protein [Mesorhizobium prunaredense]
MSSSGEEINTAKGQMHVLVQEIEVLEKESLPNGASWEEAQDQLDQLVNAGAKVLHYYASLPPHVARSILSDADVRQYRDDMVRRAESGNMVAEAIFEKEEEDRKRVAGILHNLVKSNATLDQLSRSAPSAAKYHVARMEFYDKKVQRYECMRSVCAATANLPSSTAEMRQEEEAALRLHSGGVVNSKVRQLQSRINLAQVNMAPQAIMLEAPIRELLVGENGQGRLLDNFITDVFPAFLSTGDAVMKNKGRPLDAEHCAVLEGVVERLSEFASASHSVVARLRDHQTGAGLPLELLSQIVDDAWITADEVIHLLELQPKPPAIALPADAGAAIPAETAGKTTVAESTTAPRKKGKGKRAARAGSSTARRPEPQAAAPVRDPAPEAKVLVRSDLGTKKLVSASEAHASASAAGANLAIWRAPLSIEVLMPRLERLDELLQFNVAGQQKTISQARQMKPEDAEHAVASVINRLQTQATEMQACLAALEEHRQRVLLTPVRVQEAHRKIGQLKLMLSEAQGLAKALDSGKAASSIDCMKTYPFPSQKYLEHLRAAEELEAADRPRALKGEPGSLFEIRLQPKALRNRAIPSPMWVHIHTNRPVHARHLAMLDDAAFAACHVKSNEQRGHNRQWQDARAAIGHDNVVIHRGKLTPGFCKSLLTDRA